MSNGISQHCFLEPRRGVLFTATHSLRQMTWLVMKQYLRSVCEQVPGTLDEWMRHVNGSGAWRAGASCNQSLLWESAGISLVR